jgi:hypothetical protein
MFLKDRKFVPLIVETGMKEGATCGMPSSCWSKNLTGEFREAIKNPAGNNTKLL